MFNKKTNKRTLLGLFSLFTFLFILLTLAGPSNGFGKLRYNLQNLFDRGNTPLRTREIATLVEEESAIIDVVKSASPSVVSIIVETVDYDFFSGPNLTEQGIGTGFIVDPSGIIVTNSHVVADPNGVYSVVLKDGSTYEVDEIHLDRLSDLAILEVTARDLPALELADSDGLQVGQTAIAIGNALGKFQNTVTQGIVSGISREIVASAGFGAEATLYEEVIQTDAALNPGNSGGPLLNLAGQVIGINVATTPSADNISFAIPANTLRPILATFLEEGRIIRPFLGVSYQIITEEIGQLRNLPQGAYVSTVYRASPAADAGLERGDIITAMEGAQISSENTLARAINEFSVGETVELQVDRDGQSMTMYATLEEAPREL